MGITTERLKQLATAPTCAPASVYANACGEAAGEIERLRAALRDIKLVSCSCPCCAVAGNIAEEANAEQNVEESK